MPERNYDKLAVAADANIKERNFWLNRLAGDLVRSGFPCDHRDRRNGPPVMETLEIDFTAGLISRLMGLSKGSDVKLHMILTAALVILLKKYTGSPDVIIGTPIYKQETDIDFINTVLVLRNAAAEHTTFKELLLQVRQTVRQAAENQNYPLEILLEQLGMPYEPGGHDFPLFDAAILHANIHDRKYLRYIPYNMLFSFKRADERIHGQLEYNSRLYRETTVERICNHYIRLLETVLADVDIPVSGVDILSEDEKQRILYDFNDTAEEYSRDKTVYELFEAQAERTPDKVAVKGTHELLEREKLQITNHKLQTNSKSQITNTKPLTRADEIDTNMGTITYSELNRRANRLAQVLKEKGVQADTIVGIMMERLIEMIVGIIGILKAGGAYLPIDPDYPQERVDYMLKDSGSRGLLISNTDKRRKSEIRISKHETNSNDRNSNDRNEITSDFVLNFEHLDFEFVSDFEFRASNFKIGKAEPSNLAYVIYTSGSTGRPKGVLVEHRNVIAYLHSFYREFDITARDTALQQASCSFDAFLEEVYPVLLRGGKLAIAAKETIMDREALCDFILKQGITFVSVSPLLLNEIDKMSRPIGIRIYISGGDVLKKEYITNLLAKKAGVVYNTYGPTETTVCASYHRCTAGDGSYPPIGRPIANYRVYIRGACGECVPIGVPGELCIAGDGIARGYLNNPELTDKKFKGTHENHELTRIKKKKGTGKEIQDKDRELHLTPNTKHLTLYRTGDLARWLPDGSLEFLGRRDRQVQIRGYRVELGEIEGCLSNRQDIDAAVVTVTGDQLCAYVVSSCELPAPVLRDYLEQRLPGYMIPSYFVRLEKIPLTPNGKPDRKGLPQPVIARAHDYTPPGTGVEKKLADIFSEVLEVDKNTIGIDSDFFDMGGYSWKAAVLISKIHQRMNIKLPLMEVFNTPSIRALAGYIEKAGEDKYVSVEPVETKEYYPLSPAQRRLYVIHRMAPGTTAYNLSQVLPLPPGIGVENVKAGIKILTARHESLRTSFAIVGGSPVQIIHDTEAMDPVIGSYEAVDEEEAKRIRREFARPFDLSAAPLMRLGIVDIAAAGQRKLILDMHHIITDGVSQEILMAELSALARGQELPPRKLQYKDYSQWMNSAGQCEAMKKQEKYWLGIFPDDELPVLDLALDYPRPRVQSFAGNRVRFMLDGQEGRPLRQLAKETGATMFLSVLGLFYILLARLSGQEDIIVGTPVAARRHAGLENIAGMFVNTLALRNYPSGHKTVKAFLGEIRERALQAFENQEYPFEDLVEKVNVPRDTGRNPMFDVMFSLFNPEEYAGDIPDVDENSPYKHNKSISKFDMNVTAVDQGERLFFTLAYCSKLFKPATIDRIIGCFKRIACALSENAHRKIAEIGIISEAEKRQILYEFNDTAADYPKDKTVHRLFEEQAGQTPDSVAVKGGQEKEKLQNTNYKIQTKYKSQITNTKPLPRADERDKNSGTITYRELNRRADRLAQVLKEQGVQPDTIVGIKMERSIEMIIGILGIVKAGGAYLPIDPAYPRERINYMVKDSGAKLVVNEKFFGGSRGAAFQKSPPGRRRHNTSAKQAAYVIYTSGSTGRPKGVMIRHASLVNFIFSMYANYGNDFGPSDNCLSVTNFCFDVSVCEIFMPLVFGARLVLPGYEKVFDPGELAGAIIKNAITFTYLPPGLLTGVFEELESCGSRPGLNKMLVGVEPIRDNVLENYMALNPLLRIVNGYGPTEAAICTTAYRYESREPQGNRVPIGVPLANNRVVVLDKYGSLQPVGVAGELCIAGDGLARGYLNNPELTADKFIEPQRAQRSQREKSIKISVSSVSSVAKKIYRTGDLTRWLPDGNLVFLGRRDSQVKIRGYRVELGEIEGCLSNRQDIDAAVVSVTGDRLCAYVVSSCELPAPALRDYLAQHLPDYMIPSYFVRLEAIPLTVNGKIDRRRLPQPELKAGEGYAAPRNETEKILLNIWSETLGSDAEQVSRLRGSIGIRDHFFDLGGHSLKAVAMVSAIHGETGVKVPLTEVFQSPTIERLAEYIESARQERYASIPFAETKEYYALSPGQKRFYMHWQKDPRDTAYNIFQVVPLATHVDKERLEAAFKRLIARHGSLRTSFHTAAGEPVQEIHEPERVPFALEYHEIGGHEKKEAIVHFKRPFDLTRAPLFRAGLLVTGTSGPVLLLDVHHIISDGISQEVLKDELKLPVEDLPAGLPRLRLQYIDYSEWLNSEERRAATKKQEAYWLKVFSGGLPVPDLPIDYPRPAVQSSAGASVSFMLSAGETRALKTVARKARATLFMTLLAIWNVLLSKLSGQEDIVISIPVAGRRHNGLERIVGMFSNTLALRSFPAGEKRFGDFLRETKKHALEAFDNQEYQFENLVEKVYLQKNAGWNPFLGVIFNMLSQIDSHGDIPGKYKQEPFIHRKTISRADLTVTVKDGDGHLLFDLDYCTALFKPASIERFIIYFREIMNLLSRDMELKLSRIPGIPQGCAKV